MADARDEAKPYLQRFEDLKSKRTDFDRRWQSVSDYILPGRDFTITRTPNQLRPRKVTSSVAINANKRFSAFILAYLIDPTRPFLLPNVKRGLVAAGRDTNLSTASQDYLGGVEWQVFDHMTLPKAHLLVSTGAAVQEFAAFGNMVLWQGRRRGFGPYWQTRPHAACWWAENAEGMIDTLYFRMQMSIRKIVQKWPDARHIEGWAEKITKGLDSEELFVLHCVEPRPGGRVGAVREAKPFASVVIIEDKKLVIETSGYDSFPYHVGRMNPLPGNDYALGIGWDVLPDVKVLNNIQQKYENAVELKGDPPLAVPGRMFGQQLDRRAGAVNAYNPMGLGLQRPDQAIIKLDVAGDVVAPTAHMQMLTESIERAYFTDWMNVATVSNVTAEAIKDRRDVRLRGMASIVAHLEPMMSQLGDRALEIMTAEGLIPPPPAQLAGAEVDWEYAGPLAIAQLQNQVQMLLQLINARGLVAGQDQAAAQAVDLEESLRAIAEGLGAPTRTMNSREEVAQARAAAAQTAAQQQQAEKLATVASAARDGSQAVGNVVGAHATAQSAAQDAANQNGPAPGPQPAPQGVAAPFAPAAPFGPVAA